MPNEFRTPLGLVRQLGERQLICGGQGGVFQNFRPGIHGSMTWVRMRARVRVLSQKDIPDPSYGQRRDSGKVLIHQSFWVLPLYLNNNILNARGSMEKSTRAGSGG